MKTLLALSCLCITSVANAAPLAMSPSEFTKEYLRELGEFEALTVDARADAAKTGADGQRKILSGIHSFTALELALASDANLLAQVKIDDPNGTDAPHLLLQLYQTEINDLEQMKDIMKGLVGEPKPGMDYGAQMSNFTELRAQAEQHRKMLIRVSGMVFAAMLNPQPDAQGHMSRLVITSRERGEILKAIQTSFGPKITQKGQDDYVAAAGVIYDYMHKGFRCSDDPTNDRYGARGDLNR